MGAGAGILPSPIQACQAADGSLEHTISRLIFSPRMSGVMKV